MASCRSAFIHGWSSLTNAAKQMLVSCFAAFIHGWSSLTNAAKQMLVSCHWPEALRKMRETASLTEWTVQTRVASASGCPSAISVATNDCGPIWVVRLSRSKFHGSSGLSVAAPEGASKPTWRGRTKRPESMRSWKDPEAGRLRSAIVRHRAYSGCDAAKDSRRDGYMLFSNDPVISQPGRPAIALGGASRADTAATRLCGAWAGWAGDRKLVDR